MSRYGVLLLGLLTVAGCGKSDMPRGVSIRGSVTYDGALLTQGTVNYTPAQDGQGRAAMGFIKPDGTFEMHTSRSVPGVLPGEYRITVVADPTSTAGSAPPDLRRRGRTGPPGQGSSAAQPFQHPRSFEGQKPLIPEKYASPRTSGLTDTVDESHSGTKDIVLE